MAFHGHCHESQFQSLFQSIFKTFQLLVSQHFERFLGERGMQAKNLTENVTFLRSQSTFLSLRLLLRMTFWFEFYVIVTVNVSSIVSINHLLKIPHRAHLSQILNHVHRHVSCVLFATTRYFKTRLSKLSIGGQNIISSVFYFLTSTRK